MKTRAKLHSKSKDSKQKSRKTSRSKETIVAAPKEVVAKTAQSSDDAKIAPSPEVNDATAEQRARELLSSPNFFGELLSAVQRMGLVGEQINALVIFIVGVSRLLAKPLCLFVKGASSTGKNFLTDTVLGLFPESERLNLTSASLRSWNYMGDQLEHKIVYVAERNEQVGHIHPTRLLISENELVHG